MKGTSCGRNTWEGLRLLAFSPAEHCLRISYLDDGSVLRTMEAKEAVDTVVESISEPSAFVLAAWHVRGGLGPCETRVTKRNETAPAS